MIPKCVCEFGFFLSFFLFSLLFYFFLFLMKLQRTSSVANIEIFRNQGEQEPLHTSLEVEGEALATE